MKNISKFLFAILVLLSAVVKSEAATDNTIKSYFVWFGVPDQPASPPQPFKTGTCVVTRSSMTEYFFISRYSNSLAKPTVDDELRLNGTLVKSLNGTENCDITSLVGPSGGTLNFTASDTQGSRQNVTDLYVIKVDGKYAAALLQGTPFAESNEPINAASGNTWFTEPDLYIPCNGLSLGFERRYNSIQTNANYGAMGKGWAHNYDWSLSTLFDSLNTWMTLRTGEGEEFAFYSPDGVTFVSKQGLTLQLVLSGNQYRVKDQGGVFYTFETNTLLLSSISNLWGQTVSLTYTNTSPTNNPATNLLTKVQHSNGQKLDFTYTSNLLTKVSVATNLYMSFVYNAQGLMTNATRTVGNISEVSSYLYTNNLMTQKVDAVGTVFSYGFAANGRATNLVTSGGYYQHSVSNTADLSWINYKRGSTDLVHQYGLDTVTKNVTLHTYPSVNGNLVADQYYYTTNGDVSQFIAIEGNSNLIVNSLYDANHNLTNVCSYFWFDASWINAKWNYGWNINNNTLTNVLDPEGGKTGFEYTNSFLTKSRLYYNSTSSYDTILTYTTNGLLDTVTNANGHYVKNYYDANGFATSTVAQVGPVNYATYSALGILQSVKLPDGPPLEGGMEVAPPTPRVITYNADMLGRLTNVVYLTNTMQESFFFDALGNITNRVDTAGRSTRYTYKPTGKLSSVSRTVGSTNLTTSIDYDSQFNTVSIKDAKNRPVESYVLDNMDRVISATNLEQQTMSVGYLFRGMVSNINRFDGTTVVNSYNGLGALASSTYAGSNTLSYTYKTNGLLRTARNTTCTITNTYNFANRLTNTTVTGLISVPMQNTYNYLPAGNISNVVTMAGTNTYSFDNGERVTSISSTRRGMAPLAFNVTYNGTNGLIETIACTNNGLTASYSYDLWDRVSAISWASTNMGRSFGYSYTNSGMISSFSDSGIGGNTAYGYDQLDQLISEYKTDSSGSNIFSEVIGYDEVGNRTNKIRDGVAVYYSTSNGNNRLTGWSVPQTNLTAQIDIYGTSSTNIGWDSHWGQLWVSNQFKAYPQGSGSNFWLTDFPVGLGTQKVVAAIRNQAGNTRFVTNQIFMSVVTNSAYLYNTAGCVTNIAHKGVQYSQNLGLYWDSQYQLQEVRTNGVSAERNGYDAAGRRVWNWDGTATNYFVYDGSSLVAEVNSTGALKRTYVYAALDVPLAMTVYTGATAQTYFYLTDKQGTVRGIVNEAGTLVEQYRLDAWGKVLGVYDGQSKPIDKSAIGNRLLWQGREHSWSTGLYYFRLRHYDPTVGRWLSNDPIGISGGLNQYVFCGNSPIANRDPYGLCEEGSALADFAYGAGAAYTSDNTLGAPLGSGYWPDPSRISSAAHYGALVGHGAAAVQGIYEMASGLKMSANGGKLALAGDGLTVTGIGSFLGIPASAAGVGITAAGIGITIHGASVEWNAYNGLREMFASPKGKMSFVLHNNRKSALDASGQPSGVKPEIHDKPTSKGQRWHFHDIWNRAIHHMFGKAYNKIG